MNALLKWAIRIGLSVGLLVAAAAVFMLGRWTAPPFGAGSAPSERGTVDVHEEHATVFTCSMHPQVRTTNPDDKCPICGMDLIPVPKDDGGEDDGDRPVLRVSERAVALMEIQTIPVRRMAVQRPVRLYGRIEEDERRVKTITAWASGRVDALYVDFTGQQVQRGTPMVELYSPMLIAAQEELLQALHAERVFGDGLPAAARSARDNVHAAREKLRLLGLSPVFIDEVETTGEIHERIAIPAPLDGTVLSRMIDLGEYVEVGQPLYRVADLSQLWVQLSVFESDLPWLRVGQTATLTVPSFPGRSFEGTVAFVDPVLQERTRSARMRIDLPNSDGLLKPGMFARGIVHAALDDQGAATSDAAAEINQPLVIPASAPLLTGRRAVVYVRQPGSDRPTFEPRNVSLGPRAGDQFVVLDGLAEGDLVVVNGAFRIDSELQIRGRPSMMQPESGTPLSHDHGADQVTAQRRGSINHLARDIDDDAVPPDFSRAVVEIFETYLSLVAALADDNSGAAQQSARQMQDRLLALNLEGLDDPVREAWLLIDLEMMDSLRGIIDADDLTAIRERLPALTEQTALAIRQFAPFHVGTVYRARCPMAFENAGADWLQRERTIANPYFGAAMLRCGSVTTEIPAKEGGRQ